MAKKKITEEAVQAMLDLLDDYQCQLDALALAKAEQVASVIPPEVKAILADIDAEYHGKGAIAVENAAALREELKDAVIQLGHSVRANRLQAVWSKPRVTWNTDGLMGLSITMPEITKLASVGLPTVSVRKVAG